MLIQSVDLAASFSASCVVAGGRVVSELDSYGLVEGDFVRKLTEPFRSGDTPEILILEDVPHSAPWSSILKKVCRLQGRIGQAMDDLGYLDRVLLLQPALWQRHLDVWKEKPAVVAAKAAEYGYTPPDLLDGRIPLPEAGKERTRVRSKLRKCQTDYVDAFLISKWAEQVYADLGTFDVAQTQRYIHLAR